MTVTPDALVTLLGVVLSLAFGLLPVLKDWFDQLHPQWKPLFMTGVLLLVTVGKLFYDCAGVWDCVNANAGAYLMSFLLAVVANQTTYQVAVKQHNIKTYGAATE